MEKIFYTDNCKDSTLYTPIFSKIITNLGMYMYCYLNLNNNIKESNLDFDLRNDFYNASIIVCVFGEGNNWNNINNNYKVAKQPTIICQLKY